MNQNILQSSRLDIQFCIDTISPEPLPLPTKKSSFRLRSSTYYLIFQRVDNLILSEFVGQLISNIHSRNFALKNKSTKLFSIIGVKKENAFKQEFHILLCFDLPLDSKKLHFFNTNNHDPIIDKSFGRSLTKNTQPLENYLLKDLVFYLIEGLIPSNTLFVSNFNFLSFLSRISEIKKLFKS